VWHWFGALYSTVLRLPLHSDRLDGAAPHRHGCGAPRARGRCGSSSNELVVVIEPLQIYTGESQGLRVNSSLSPYKYIQ